MIHCGAPDRKSRRRSGPTIDKNGNFIMTHLDTVISGMFGNYSTNNGKHGQQLYNCIRLRIKNLATTDDAPSSPLLWKILCCMVFIQCSNPHCNIKHNKRRSTWSAALQINTSCCWTLFTGLWREFDLTVKFMWFGLHPIHPHQMSKTLLVLQNQQTAEPSTVTNNAYDMNGNKRNISTKSNIRTNGFTE